MSSIFQATVRRSGNSLVVTIPKGVAEGLKVKNGSVLRVNVHLIDEEKDVE